MGGSEAEDLSLELEVTGDEENEIAENIRSECFFSPARRRFVPFLDIRFVDGDSLGLRYTHIDAILFSKRGAITIISPLYRVKLEGRNLGVVYLRLLSESIQWLKELPGELDKLDANAVVINSIKLVSDDEMQE
jgi:hypothetical protein